MKSLVFAKFFPGTEASRAYINSVTGLANWVCTFDSNRMCEIANAGVTLDLEARLIHG